MSLVSYRFFDRSDVHNLIDMAIFYVFIYSMTQLWSRRNALKLNEQRKLQFFIFSRLFLIGVFGLSGTLFSRIHLNPLARTSGKLCLRYFFEFVTKFAIIDYVFGEKVYKILDEAHKKGIF